MGECKSIITPHHIAFCFEVLMIIIIFFHFLKLFINRVALKSFFFFFYQNGHDDIKLEPFTLQSLHLQRIHFFKNLISPKKTKERVTKYCPERTRYLINLMNSNFTAKTTLFILLLFHSLYFYVIVFFFFTSSFQYARAKKKKI